MEYAIVLSACLNSIGLKSRTLALKPSDVEISADGHVAVEVYLDDIKKWGFLDAQFDVIFLLNGLPLNAVEIQKSISENYSKLKIKSSESNVKKRNYSEWIYPYLYYFDYPFDNRVGIDLKRNKILNKSSIMLVPLNANNPKTFGKTDKIDNCLYTHSVLDFYRPIAQ